MDAKIDMRAIVELLDEIPEISHVLRNLTDKVDTLDKEMILTSILSQITGLKDGLGSGFYEINKLVHDLIQGLHDGPIDSAEKKLLHIIEVLESNAQKPVQCELSEIEHGFQSFGKTVEDQLGQLQQEISVELSKGDQELAGIRENNEILQKVLSLLDFVEKKTTKGFGSGDCQLCQALQDIFKLGQGNAHMLHQLSSIIQNLPREVGDLLMSDGGLGGIRKDIQTLIRVDEGVRGSIAQLAHLIEALSVKSDRFFSQHQRIIVETQYAVEETAKTIQKTASSTEQAVKRMVQEAAKASRSASRSCT